MDGGAATVKLRVRGRTRTQRASRASPLSAASGATATAAAPAGPPASPPPPSAASPATTEASPASVALDVSSSRTGVSRPRRCAQLVANTAGAEAGDKGATVGPAADANSHDSPQASASLRLGLAELSLDSVGAACPRPTPVAARGQRADGPV